MKSGSDERRIARSFRAVFVLSLAANHFPAIATAQPLQPRPESVISDSRLPANSSVPELNRVAARLCRDGAKYLLATQQQDGGWVSDMGVGISALCLRALIETPGIGPDHPAVKRGIEYVLKAQRPDGGIYGAQGFLKNYETSVALSMLAALGPEAHRDVRDKAIAFLKDAQWDESEDKSPNDPWYGGAGYGRGQRPDLSNLQIMLDALKDSGLPPADPAYQKALKFIERCQMRGEGNDLPFARGSTQGGFIYSTARGGESKAGTTEVNGRRELRCYGSMTYAGLKSMIYCGLSRDDARVQAAVDWIRRNWTLEHNPNMPDRSQEGLYYYYHTFARALAALGDRQIVDEVGRSHDWRFELIDALARRQQTDHRWVNMSDRWMEGWPELTTAYAMLALQAACPDMSRPNTAPDSSSGR